MLQVTEKKARDWCASRGNIPYFETSAKEGYNVEEAFLCVAKIALENEHQQDMWESTICTFLTWFLINVVHLCIKCCIFCCSYFRGISDAVSEAEQQRSGCACWSDVFYWTYLVLHFDPVSFNLWRCIYL